MKCVSVIMPCYNDGAYIQEAVDSVRAQTYPNIELVIVDDGSDDPQTVEVLKKLEQDGAKLFHSNRLRPAGARNLGISESSGTFILPVDADDRISPTYVEKAVQILEADEHVGVVYCKADLFGEASGPWDLPDYNFDTMLLDNIVFVSAMFRRSDWEDIGGFCTDLHDGMEDYDFWLSILERDREIVQIPETLFHYRIKPVSRTTRFLKDDSVVKQTYRALYLRHPALYEKHRDKYAMILRDALIEQLFINRKYKESIAVAERLKKYPVIRHIIKKFVLK